MDGTLDIIIKDQKYHISPKLIFLQNGEVIPAPSISFYDIDLTMMAIKRLGFDLSDNRVIRKF